MPLPDNQLLHAEIKVFGSMLAAGSTVAPAQNVFYYRRLATAVPMNKANLSTVFQANVIATLLAGANTRYRPNFLTIRMINDVEDFPTFFTAPGNGAIATDGGASDTAVFMLLRTALRGRNYLGKKHFAGINESDTTGDVLTGAGLANWQATRNNVAATLTAAEGNQWRPFVLSKTLSQLLVNPTNVVGADVTSVLLDLNVGTMRRRRTATVISP